MMEKQIMSKDESLKRRKFVFDHFTKSECLLKNNPPSAYILISAGIDIRSYYIMEGYTDNFIYLDIREMFRKFRQGEKISFSGPILDELIPTGLELALFCLRSRYNLIVDLSGRDAENLNIVHNALTKLGYRTTKILIDGANNPYIDIDPDDFADILTPHIWELIHVNWIKCAAITVLIEESDTWSKEI